MTDLDSAVANLRTAFKQAAAELEGRMQAATGNVHEAVSQRVQLAKDLGIASNLGLLFETLENKPGRTLLREWKEPLRPKNLEVTKDDRRKLIRFTLGEETFQLDLDVGRPGTLPDGEYYQSAEMKLTRDQEVLFESTLDVGRDRDLGYWHHPARGQVLTVRSFRPGEWIADITECAESLRHAQEVERIKKKYDPEKARELTERFGLDQEGDEWRPAGDSALQEQDGVRDRQSSAVRRLLSSSFEALAMILGIGVLIALGLGAAALLFSVFGLWAVGILIGFGLLVVSGFGSGR